jgi:putative ABC transport system permease protein
VRLFPYHMRLAARSLRRDLSMSVVMLIALAVGTGFWTLSVTQYLRFRGVGVRLPPTLHQPEILRARDANAIFAEGVPRNVYYAPTSLFARTQVSYPDYQKLAAIGIPSQQCAGVRAEAIVRAPGVPARERNVRFTQAAFFAMFQRRFAEGGPWTDGGAASGQPPVVLGRETARWLFPGGGAVGRSVFVDGKAFRVTGVLTEYEPLNAPWHLLLIGGNEDALFLPFEELDRLQARPEQPVFQSPYGRARADLLASQTRFVNFWVDLPTAEQQEAYRRELDARFGPGRTRLRSLSEWRQQFGMDHSQIAFFSFLGLVVVVGGAFNLARWLLTKGLSRGAELGVYRALGAPQSSIFWRVVAEAMLLAWPAVLLAPLAALPTTYLFNRYVRLVDMPQEMTVFSVASSGCIAGLLCMVGALYPAWRLSRTPPTTYLGRP